MTMGIHPSPFELDHFMNLMDADGSGMVEFGDFVSVMSSELNDEALEKEIEELKTLFAFVDKDGNGFIDSSELIRGMKAIDIRLEREEADHIIKEIDSNGHGCVSFAEFATCVLNFKEQDDDHH